MMDEYPINFVTPMVQEILRGRKTMTRRLVHRVCADSEDRLSWNLCNLISKDEAEHMLARQKKSKQVHVWSINDDGSVAHLPYRYGKREAGQRLWVREAFVHCKKDEFRPPLDEDETCYKANVSGKPCGTVWKSGRFMPRELSRINLETTAAVRVEHLQDMTPEDAIKEGFDDLAGFRKLWNKLQDCNHTWKCNPWVFVIEFKALMVRPGMTITLPFPSGVTG